MSKLIWVTHKLPIATTNISHQDICVVNQNKYQVKKDRIVTQFLNSGRLVECEAHDAEPKVGTDGGDETNVNDELGADATAGTDSGKEEGVKTSEETTVKKQPGKSKPVKKQPGKKA